MIASLTVDNDFVRRIDQRLVDFRTVDYGQMKRYRSIVGAQFDFGQSAAQQCHIGTGVHRLDSALCIERGQTVNFGLVNAAPSTALTATAFPAPGGVYNV